MAVMWIVNFKSQYGSNIKKKKSQSGFKAQKHDHTHPTKLLKTAGAKCKGCQKCNFPFRQFFFFCSNCFFSSERQPSLLSLRNFLHKLLPHLILWLRFIINFRVYISSWIVDPEISKIKIRILRFQKFQFRIQHFNLS